MKEPTLQEIVVAMTEGQGQAIGMLVQALCQQLDPAQLKRDLERSLASAKQLHSTSPIALKVLQQAMAAAQAESMLQAKRPGAGASPSQD